MPGPDAALMGSMKTIPTVGAALVLASSLTGCVAVPYPEPVAYGPPPPPPPVVVVRPAYYGYYHHGYGPYWRRPWRY
jgi:hypothetical protein